MATLDELQAQITALQQQVAALTTPPDTYYTSIWSGEEIDNAVGKVVNGEVGGVSSFNGRTGAVTPQAGDYNATQIPVSAEEGAETVAAALNNKPNRNLLDNWYFMNPVNQRGVSGTISEAGYFIDRWKLVSGSVTLTSTGITINGTISQILETAVGTNVTASALTTTGIVSVSYDNSSKTFTITGTGQTFVAAKLELGSSQSLAHQDEDGSWVLNDIPDYGTELAKCQRYQVVIPTLDISGCTNNTTTLYANIPTPVPMRAIPSIENNGVFAARGNSTAQTNLTASTYSTSFTPQGIRVGITGEFSINVAYGVAINAQIILNANL
nr:MAG TPA: hypothetical protein [Caudoviricetes sp.]